MKTNHRILSRVAAVGAIPAVAVATIALLGVMSMSTTHVTAEEGATSPAGGAPKLETITFGSGCFWCTEALFSELDGVTSAVSGYSGGSVENPSYQEVCSGTTGHAEAVQVTFDPKKISVADLLEVFWKTHDPTTLNRQGADVGTQYRSAVFYHNDEQKAEAETYKKKLNESGAFERPIITEITKFTAFYPADQHHQEYYATNPEQGYCRVVIQPKLDKFRAAFKDKLKTAK